MKVIYEANDGTKFDKESNCKEYELACKETLQNQVEFKVGDEVRLVTSDLFEDHIGCLFKIKKITGLYYDLGLKFTTGVPALQQASQLELVTSKQHETDNLSQAELQFLTKVLSVGLREYASSIKELKEDINSLWSACDGTEGTSGVFNCLNAHKDDLKASKALYKKLSEVQRKLKKQAGK